MLCVVTTCRPWSTRRAGGARGYAGGMDTAPSFVERDRRDTACTCGCGRRWLVSAGEVRRDDAVAAFVAMPTIHGAASTAITVTTSSSVLTTTPFAILC